MRKLVGSWKLASIVATSLAAVGVLPAQTLTTLVNFGGANGELPYPAPIQATDGNFYGTAEMGGAASQGTVFRMTAAGTLTTLHSFSGGDGAISRGDLSKRSTGIFTEQPTPAAPITWAPSSR